MYPGIELRLLRYVVGVAEELNLLGQRNGCMFLSRH